MYTIQRRTLILLSIILTVIAQCKTTPTHERKTDSQFKSSPPTIQENSKKIFLESDEIRYFEIPGFTELVNPEELETFSHKVQNPIYIDKFRRITALSAKPYSYSPENNCKPSYNSALVFRKGTQKETVLFSINCGLLYLYEEKLYLDVGLERMEIENTFRQIRSGRN